MPITFKPRTVGICIKSVYFGSPSTIRSSAFSTSKGRLSAEAKDLLRKFDEVTGHSLRQGEEAIKDKDKKNKKKGFMDKVKEVFED